ncbi:MAG: 2-C-methyl-D-erythritol 2,4-cyclodiphosphate synthase [Candidatus Omnitrophota bacterium]
MRVGIGYDIHALKKGRKLILGGVRIPHPKGLLGHSDGDVLLHAICDAVLGAMGEADLGEHFRDTDPKYRGANSMVFVKKVLALLKAKKLRIANVDTTVVAEKPTLSDYKDRMRRNIADAFGLGVSQVGVKAKTSEGLGPVGKGQAIECFAVASLRGK